MLVEQDDALYFQKGEEITLMSWGNVIITEIKKSDHGVITGLQADLHLEGDVSKTKKVHWLAATGTTQVEAQLWEFDYLLTKDSLGKTDDLDQFLNPSTAILTNAVLGDDCRGLANGDIIQLERKGYFRVDKAPGGGPDHKAVLFKIPTK